MSEEETIRQYVYYSNANYQAGMKQLSCHDKWDYFFPDQLLKGKILNLQKTDAGAEADSGGSSHKSHWVVRMKTDYDGTVTYENNLSNPADAEQDASHTAIYENHGILLTKDPAAGDWKISLWET